MAKELHELGIADNFLFRKVFLDKEVCKAFFKALLGKEVIDVQSITAELDSSPEHPENRGVRFDIFIEGTTDVAAVEMQVVDDKNLPVRTRVYQSHLTTRAAMAGDKKYRNVKDTYLVFICNFDPLGEEMPVYSVERYVLACGGSTHQVQPWEDGSHTYILNSRYKVPAYSTELCEFLNYVRTGVCDRFPSGDLMKVVYKRVNDVVNSDKVRKEYVMYEEELRKESYEEGLAVGVEKLNNVIRAFARQLSPEEIASMSQLPLATVREILSSDPKQGTSTRDGLQRMNFT